MLPNLLAVVAAAQLLAPPAGLPSPRLTLIHFDGAAAVHVDVSPDSGTSRLALVTPFDTQWEPYWLKVDVDCAAGRVRSDWRQSAVGFGDAPRMSLDDWPDPLEGTGPAPALGRHVCAGETLFPGAAAAADAEAAMQEAYDLRQTVREQPDLYTRAGDLGETLEFLGLARDDFGWFVDPLSAHATADGGAEIQTLRIAGRDPGELPGARYVWSRMRFSCETPTGRTLVAFAYDDRHRLVDGPGVETELPVFAPNSPLALSRQFACSPGTPPESQTVQGLGSALIGIRDHFAPGGPADRARQEP